MTRRLVQIALVIPDYDDALAYYTEIFQFQVIEDTVLNDEKRWVVINPDPLGEGCNILLAKASNDRQEDAIGNQSGGRVFLFLFTDDIDTYLDALTQHDVYIERPIAQHAYGKVAVVKDKYGNLWDIIQPNENNALAPFHSDLIS